MKALSLFVFACGILAAQTAAPTPSLPDLPDGTVIAVFDDGVKFTMGDFRNLYAAVPGNQQAMLRDRKGFLEQYALLRKLALMAEDDKLDQTSPNKEALAFNRMVLLGQMKLSEENTRTVVAEDDVTKFYEANKSQYQEVKVKAIYIAFTKALASSQASNGKRLLSEDEARAKAQKLLADIRGGADFVKLARENSDDAASREKDGDFATLHRSDTIPDAIKAAVFSLKRGEVTEPIEQPNGFYLLRAEEVGTRSLAEVHGDIYTALQQEYARKWIQTTHDSVKVQFPSAEFMSGEKAPAPGK
jgi:peptidyl-prolyl cis-trans isomerase C